jgi:hemolysin III
LFESQFDALAEPAMPRFRGVAHSVAFAIATPTGVALVIHTRTGVAQAAAFVFAASVTGMLGVSTLFHRRTWNAARRRWIRLLDHAMIYVLIAGTYTPVTLLVIDAGWRMPLLTVVWGGAIVATIGRLLRPEAPPWVSAATCLALGWVSVVVLPQIAGRLGLQATALLVAGGIAYTVGAVVYARRSPDPFPDAFGYHEVFHALVVVAVACQYATIALYVLPRA